MIKAATLHMFVAFLDHLKWEVMGKDQIKQVTKEILKALHQGLSFRSRIQQQLASLSNQQIQVERVHISKGKNSPCTSDHSNDHHLEKVEGDIFPPLSTPDPFEDWLTNPQSS